MEKAILVLRLGLGWFFLYAGVTKVLNPEWTAAGFLKGAKTLPGLYQWFGLSQNIGWVNFLNEWGLTLVGAALILGVFVRFSSVMGILLMVLYYVPSLRFPYAGDHALVVDDHIINILVLALFIKTDAGRFWGLDSWLRRQSFIKNSFLRSL